MINKPFISIIIPIYNVEQYLNKCIESVLNQNYSNYEIILVNDGSPDNCGSICDFYKEKSDKIKVLHLENGGVCRARNKGMEIAKGEYFCFIDSDDWVEEDYLKDFVDNITDSKNLIVQDAIRELPDKEQRNYFEFGHKSYDLSKDLVELFKDGFFQEGFPWNKLYSRKIIFENNLQFDPKIKLGDDEKWNLNYYKYINKMTFINKSNYHYLYNPGSISNQARPFDRELLRFQFRADYFNFLVKSTNKNNLKDILSAKLESFLRVCIIDRIYKSDMTINNRIFHLKEISNQNPEYLRFIYSPLFFRNIDYVLLKNKNVVLMDFFKKIRLKLNA